MVVWATPPVTSVQGSVLTMLVETDSSPVITDLVHGQHDDVNVVQERPLLHVFPQDHAHRFIQTVQNGHQDQLWRWSQCELQPGQSSKHKIVVIWGMIN